MDKLEKQTLLDNLKNAMTNCTECEFAKEPGYCNVFGEGPIDADIMSISEAPGKAEFDTGRPYQGRAGNFWEDMLASVELSREDIYICNGLKGRPPGNKLNDYGWLDNCKHYLQQQISIVQPKLIIVFGKPAGYALGLITREVAERSAYGKLLGPQPKYMYKSTDNETMYANMVWLYHPSYLMRGNKEKECAAMFEHLYNAKKDLDGLDPTTD